MNIKYMHKKFFQVKCGNIIKYRSNEYRWNIGEDNIAMPLKNAGAMTKSRRESGCLEK